MEPARKCLVCGSEKNDQYIDCKDFTSSKLTFNIVKCADCGFLYTNPRPSENEIGDYYKSEEYISHTGTSKGLINSLYHRVRRFTLNGKLALVRRFHPGAHGLLDYGAGTGEFLATVKAAGFDVKGIEPSPGARLRAKENLDIDLVSNTELTKLEDNSTDVITMWHVLEHVHRIEDTLENLKRIMKKNGVIIIAVPNADSFDAGYYKQYWAAYDVPRHLYHFNMNSMTKLMARHGLMVEKVLPMWFDSFYVSLLSGRYKSKQQGTGGTSAYRFIEALTIGFISNLAGIISKRKFSSLIYVVKQN